MTGLVGFQEIAAHRRFVADKYQKISLFETPHTAMDVYCLLPGQAQKVHAHKDTDKYYVVLDGTARIRVGEEEREVGPGWAALSRPGVEHGVSNPGPEPLTVLVFQAPKSF